MGIKAFFRDWCNLLSFAIGLIPTIVLYVVPETWIVSPKVFVILLFLLLVVVWICIKLYFMIQVNEVKSYLTIMECVQGQCVCKANRLLSVHSVVSFYFQQGNFERLIAYGYVETINTKNIAQIKAYSNIVGGAEDIIAYINDHKENIIIRPTITTDALESVYALMKGDTVNG